jgi:type I restriction enzyme S subunit
MIEDQKPYPEYKDSEVLSVGDIPSHWKMIRSGYLFREVIDTSHPDFELLSIDRFRGIIRQSDIGRKERASKDRSSYKRIRKGQLGYNLMNAFMGSIGISRYDGIISPAYAVGQPQKEMNPWYYHHLYRTPIYAAEINRYSYGIMYERNRLYFDYFKRIPVPYPPVDEQNKIVSIIVQKSKEFQKIINIKHCLIDLLNEQKQKIISRAVTRGIEPTVRLKPSGIEWLGDVPEHWEKLRLGYSAKLIVPMRDKPPKFGGNIPWIRIEDFDGKYISDSKSEQRVGDKIIDDLNLKVFPAGTVLCSCSCRMGATAIVTKPLITNQTFIGIIPGAKLTSEFVYYILQVYAEQLQIYATGAIQKYLSREDFHQIHLFVPSIEEQQSINAYLNREVSRVDTIISKIQSEISAISEYRTHIISDLVTGKVDIRNIVVIDLSENDSSDVFTESHESKNTENEFNEENN